MTLTKLKADNGDEERTSPRQAAGFAETISLAECGLRARVTARGGQCPSTDSPPQPPARAGRRPLGRKTW